MAELAASDWLGGCISISRRGVAASSSSIRPLMWLSDWIGVIDAWCFFCACAARLSAAWSCAAAAPLCETWGVKPACNGSHS